MQGPARGVLLPEVWEPQIGCVPSWSDAEVSIACPMRFVLPLQLGLPTRANQPPRVGNRLLDVTVQLGASCGGFALLVTTASAFGPIAGTHVGALASIDCASA